MIQHGRDVVRQSLPNPRLPEKMYDGHCALMYLNDQARVVRQTGRCEHRCACDLITVGRSEQLVCPATFEPCPQRALQPLTELFGKINRHGNSDTQ
jgi:hypothetical protein